MNVPISQKLNYFGTLRRVGCEQVVCMWPRHPVVNAFIYFIPSCFFCANDESPLHHVAIWAQLFFTVKSLPLPSPFRIGHSQTETSSVLTHVQVLTDISTYYVYTRLAEIWTRFSGLQIQACVMWSHADVIRHDCIGLLGYNAMWANR